jgi:hypothetical protein
MRRADGDEMHFLMTNNHLYSQCFLVGRKLLNWKMIWKLGLQRFDSAVCVGPVAVGELITFPIDSVSLPLCCTWFNVIDNVCRKWFLAYFLILKKIKVGLCDHHAVCGPCYQRLNGWTSFYESWYVHHMAFEPISAAYFINPCPVPFCVFICVSPPIVARQWLGKNYRGNEYTQQ